MFTNDQMRALGDKLARATVDCLQNSELARKTCLECIHFDRQAEFCRHPGLSPHGRPPAAIIAYGCNAFEYDPIPF